MAASARREPKPRRALRVLSGIVVDGIGVEEVEDDDDVVVVATTLAVPVPVVALLVSSLGSISTGESGGAGGREA
jgi:hypothetical protein